MAALREVVEGRELVGRVDRNVVKDRLEDRTVERRTAVEVGHDPIPGMADGRKARGLAQRAGAIDAGVETLGREGRVVGDVNQRAGRPAIEEGAEGRRRRAATQASSRAPFRIAPRRLDHGLRVRCHQVDGRALPGNQPLFEVNHSASFQGARRSPKASSTTCTALIGLWSSNSGRRGRRRVRARSCRDAARRTPGGACASCPPMQCGCWPASGWRRPVVRPRNTRTHSARGGCRLASRWAISLSISLGCTICPAMKSTTPSTRRSRAWAVFSSSARSSIGNEASSTFEIASS